MYTENTGNNYRDRAGYEVSRIKLQNRTGSDHSVQSLIAENARAQEVRERRTSDLAPGAYSMGAMLEKNSERYRTGEGGRYMTTEDYRSLYTSRRIGHINEMARVYNARRVDRQNITDNEAAGKVSGGMNRNSGTASRGNVPDRNGATVSGRPIPGTRQSAYSTTPVSNRKASPASVGDNRQMVRREREGEGERKDGMMRRVGNMASEWFPMNEMYVRRKSAKRFPVAMITMIMIVSVSLLLIVCGSVMTSHMERQVTALNKQVSTLSAQAQELEAKLDLKNDPVMLEKLASDLGMVDSDYVDMRVLRVTSQEKSEKYETAQAEKTTISTLLDAMGFLRR